MRSYFIKFLSFTIVLCGIISCGGKDGSISKNIESSEIKRLIVTNSNAFEMLVGLGAADNIIATNDMARKSFIKEDKTWSSIGKWQSPNIEAIVNLKPDLIVSYQKWPDPVMFESKLAPFNIKVDRLDCYNMNEYHNDLNKLASYVGKSDRAAEMIKDFDSIVVMIKEAVSNVNVKKKVYLEFSDFTSMSKGTGNHEMLMLANVENIASDFPIQYPKISTEWLLNEKPDYIFKIITTDIINREVYDRFVSRPGWDKLDAVKDKKVYLISSEICSGPRAMIGSLYIAGICYPELFDGQAADSLHKFWLNKYYDVEYESEYLFH